MMRLISFRSSTPDNYQSSTNVWTQQESCKGERNTSQEVTWQEVGGLAARILCVLFWGGFRFRAPLLSGPFFFPWSFSVFSVLAFPFFRSLVFASRSSLFCAASRFSVFAPPAALPALPRTRPKGNQATNCKPWTRSTHPGWHRLTLSQPRAARRRPSTPSSPPD